MSKLLEQINEQQEFIKELELQLDFAKKQQALVREQYIQLDKDIRELTMELLNARAEVKELRFEHISSSLSIPDNIDILLLIEKNGKLYGELV